MPKFCSHCFRQGHGEAECHVLNPELWVPKGEERQLVLQNMCKEYRPKKSRKGTGGRSSASPSGVVVIAMTG